MAGCGYHFTAKPIKFGAGQSAVNTAAYNSRSKLDDERQDCETKDYSKKGATEFSGIFAPKDAPDWTQDRSELWNRAEAAERQKNGQPARNVILSFPHEIDEQGRKWLVKDFAREQFARQGMIADVNLHPPDKGGDQRNYHAHILLTMRKLDGDDFAKTKCRDWNSKEQLHEWRAQWANKCGNALKKAGYEVEAERWRHGYETLPKQREAALERGDKEFVERLGEIPTRHKGQKTTAQERQSGASLGADDEPKTNNNEIPKDEERRKRATNKEQEKAHGLAADLYDSGGMESQQRDALRHIGEHSRTRKLAEMQEARQKKRGEMEKSDAQRERKGREFEREQTDARAENTDRKTRIPERYKGDDDNERIRER